MMIKCRINFNLQLTAANHY